MNKPIIIPKTIVIDFDRTITYLYMERKNLIILAKQVIQYYQKYITIPNKFKKGKIDGYFVWHDLHNLVSSKYLEKEAIIINEKAENIVKDYELIMYKNVGLFDGVKESIIKLSKSGIQLGIVSSNSTEVLKYALEENEITHLFDFVKGRTIPFNPEYLKPNGYPIIEAQTSLNSTKSDFWYVGDDVVDILAANKASVISIGVTTGRYNSTELNNAGAVYVFESIVKMVEIIEKSIR